MPLDVVWWALRKLGIEEWLVKIIQSMYRSAQSCVRVNKTFSDDYLAPIELHQGSASSPLLFVMVLEALCREIRSEFPEEQLYVDDSA